MKRDTWEVEGESQSWASGEDRDRKVDPQKAPINKGLATKLTERQQCSKVGIPNFVSGPGEYIMEGEYVILKITGLLYLYWAIRLGCYAMGLPMSDSVWNCGQSLVLWLPGTSGSIGNGILGENFPEREYNLLGPKKTRKQPKFQPCPAPHVDHPPVSEDQPEAEAAQAQDEVPD